MRTIHASLQEAEDTIGKVDGRALLCDVLGVNTAFLIANPFHIITESQDARIDSLVAQRVLGQPVAYLLGKREFYGRDFAVNDQVLIPRPDTETLVEAALARIPKTGACRVLDLGTGSGAIAITLACERPEASVTAVDASAGALDVARTNAQHLSARVEFLEGGWFAPVAGRRFDLVAANPPYIAAKDPHLGQGDLRFEPGMALTDGSADGLASIRAIVAGARVHLAPGGWLLLEHGYDQADRVAELLAAAGFADLARTKDLAGIERVAAARAP